jgi:hypothetical protein
VYGVITTTMVTAMTSTMTAVTMSDDGGDVTTKMTAKRMKL